MIRCVVRRCCPTIAIGAYCGPPNGRPNVAASTPGSARHALEQLLRELIALLEGRVLRRRQRHADDQHAIGA